MSAGMSAGIASDTYHAPGIFVNVLCSKKRLT